MYECDRELRIPELTPEQAGKKLGAIPRPIPAPTSIPDPGDTSLDFEQARPSQEPDYNAIQRDSADRSYSALAGPNGDFAVPTLSELGLKPATTPHRGGETLALQALDIIIADTDYTATFSKPLTAPTAFSPQSTTLLSPHHHFGSLSCRLLYWRAQDTVTAYKKPGASQPPTSLTGQLLFRDMYFGAQAALGYAFGQTVNNPHCRFIPWHLPSRIDRSNGLITGTYDIDSPQAEEHLRRWREGITGFPWIDGLMRQLKTEGWIHHLGRHAVASFLTRGGCYIDWERGAEVFEEWLIDHEAACNIGNWQWLACVAFYSQFHRIYSPIAFPKRWDKEGKFVRRYVPELERFDEKYIYEPWKAPVVDQKRWGCLVRGREGGVEGELRVYPKPMFEFKGRRDVCLKAMKKAYEVGLYGNDPRVLDGSWRALFDDEAEGPTEGREGPIGAMVGDGEAEHEEDVGDDEAPPAHAKSHMSSESPKSTRSRAGQKRSADQTTLDGIFKRLKS